MTPCERQPPAIVTLNFSVEELNTYQHSPGGREGMVALYVESNANEIAGRQQESCKFTEAL